MNLQSSPSGTEAAQPQHKLQGRKFWLALAVVWILGWGLRSLTVTQYERLHPQANAPLIDEESYDSWALQLVNPEKYGAQAAEPYFQEPLYPHALAQVYRWVDESQRWSVARQLQACLGGAVGMGIVCLGWICFSPAAGLLAGLLWALYRPALLFPALLLKPNLFLPVWVGLLLCFALRSRCGDKRSWQLCMIAGALTGLGSLLRGNVLIMIPFLALLFAWQASGFRFKHALLFAAGAMLALLPVAVRNQVVGGQFVLTTSGAGTNFFGGNNADNPYGVATEFDWVRGIPEFEAQDWRREAERRRAREEALPEPVSLSSSEVSVYWRNQVLVSMLENPLLHLSIFWNKFRLCWNSYEVPDNHHLEWDARYLPLLRQSSVGLSLPGFGLSGYLGLAGVLTWLMSRRRAKQKVEPGVEQSLEARFISMQLLVLLVLYAGTIVLTVMSMRVRLALVPILLPFAGYWVMQANQYWRGRAGERSQLAVSGVTLLGGLVLAAGLAHWPVFGSETLQKDLDEREYNLAAGWLNEGAHLDEVRDKSEDLLARYPGSARLNVMLAELDYRAGRDLLGSSPRDAKAKTLISSALERLDAIERGSASAQDRYRLDYLQGAILHYMAEWSGALDAYERALEFDGDRADLRRRYALCLAEVAVTQADPLERQQGLQKALGILGELMAEEPGNADLPGLAQQLEAALKGS